MAGPTGSRGLQLSAALRLHCGRGRLSACAEGVLEVRRADPGGTLPFAFSHLTYPGLVVFSHKVGIIVLSSGDYYRN